MRFSRNCQGRNFLHLAANKGHVPVLTELVETAPPAASETAGGCMSMTAICTKHRELVALKMLTPMFVDLISAGDEDRWKHYLAFVCWG